MAQTAPTKGNLTAARRSRALAQNGYELMDRKRNILIRELMARQHVTSSTQLVEPLRERKRPGVVRRL